jgi:ACS family hexuronate transporter-like MFS transporter
MIAPPLTVGLTLAYGWRSAFVVTGAMGIVWAGLWFTLYRSSPNPRSAAVLDSPMEGLAILRQRRFWALAVPRFLAEPAWQTFNFWTPLYLATERHWDIQHIALFAWAPFLAADLGGVASGYLSPALLPLFRFDLLKARTATVWIGAILMIAPACVALTGNPYWAIGLLCVGGFAHQTISVAINTLSADLFASRELGTANGWVGSAGWSGGLVFSLLIGQVVKTTGFGPLFACLGVFDLIGATALMILLRGLAPFEQTP